MCDTGTNEYRATREGLSMLKKYAASAAVIGLTALASLGCSSGSGTDDKSGSASPAATGGTSSSPAAASANKKTEKVYVYANLGNLSQTTETSKPEASEEVKKAILDKTGIEVIPIIPPKGSENDKLNILLASNEPLDIFKGTMAEHQAKGAAMPLDELLDKYGPNIKKLWPDSWGKEAWDALKGQDGKIYAIPEIPVLAGNTVLLREDWLNKLGLKMPKTIDELEAVLQAFKDKDPAGNGQTIPLLTDLSGLNMGLAAGFMDIAYANWLDTDGKVKPPVLNPGYKDFVVKMADWYKKGYIYKESFSSNRDKLIELVKQNRAASAAVWYTTVLGNDSVLRQNVPEAKYAVAGELQGPKGFVTSTGGVSRGGYMISKNAKNPEAAIKYIDWLQSDIENYLTAFFGVKDKHWKYTDPQNKIMEGLNRDYIGEYITGGSFAITVQYRKNDPVAAPQFDYMGKYITDMTRVKKPSLLSVEYKFDQKAISQKVPTLADITRMIDQEVVKFIMGARPISEFDKFLQELNKAGLDKWIDAYTSEYNRVKG